MAIHDSEYFLKQECLKVSAGDTFASLDDLLKVFGISRETVVRLNNSIEGGVRYPRMYGAHLWWPAPSTRQAIEQNYPKWWYNVFEGDTITEFNNNYPCYYKEVLRRFQSAGSYRVTFKRDISVKNNGYGTFQFIGIYELDVDATVASRKVVWRKNTTIDEFRIDFKDTKACVQALNPQQQAFVDLPSDKNVRLLAPAGSGKTQTLLYRCKRLLTENPGQRVLLVTFTRKACEELKARLIEDAGLAGLYAKIEIATLNSFGYRIIRHQNPHAKLVEEREFAVYFRHAFAQNECGELFLRKLGDAKWVETNAKPLMKMVDRFKSLGFDHASISTLQAFAGYVQCLKNLGAGELLKQWIDEFQGMELVPENGDESVRLTALYENFWLFCQSTIRKMWQDGFYTLEDQKYWGWRIIKDAGRTNGRVCYNHIMVDEFQDINPLDLNFIKALRDRYDATMTIVGDDDQAIFEWRGAIPEYILHPEKHFERDFDTQILETNYRSPRNIVAMAKELIDHNKNRVEKEMSANKQLDAEVTRLDTSDAETILEALTHDALNRDFKSVAVMVRKRCHLLAVQMQLALRRIPFIASGDINLFMSSAFKSLGGMLQLKDKIAKGQLNDHDSIAVAVTDILALVAEKPPSEERRARIQTYLSGGTFTDMNGAVACVEGMPDDVVGENLTPARAINALTRFLAARNVRDAINEIGEQFSGLKRDFSRADEDIFLADPPFDELKALASAYGEDFGRFKADIEQAVQQKGIVLFSNNANAGSYMNGSFPKIELTTALRTKGGQFDAVYVLHANKDTWPIKHAETDAQLEAERRLFYVAITRTQKKLVFVVDKDESQTPYLEELGLEK